MNRLVAVGGRTRGLFRLLIVAGVALALRPTSAGGQGVSPDAGAVYISTGFENASPLQWDVSADDGGTVNVRLLYDYERASPNRAAGHWHFQLQGKPGSELTLVLHNFDNVWNGKPGSPVSKKSICFTSPDGKRWQVIPAELIEGNRLRFRVRLEAGSLYLARLEPYRISDLDRLLDEIRENLLVEITPIGKTVEGRPLEIVRIGNPDAPHRVLLRARAHPWEPGGNWVLQGLIRSLLSGDDVSRRCLARYCVYIMPMANKDGVARGLTRFNVQGMDLNRNWDKPADAKLAPENHALERWLQEMIDRGRTPQLAIDLHNDEGGRLHVSRPPVPDLERHLARMKLFEQLLRKHTWFTEGATEATFRNSGTMGEGLLQRYGIDACIHELNCNWIAGLDRHPTGEAWEQYGRGLRHVFFDYFAPTARQAAPR